MCKIEEQKCSSFFCELYALFFMRFLHFGLREGEMTIKIRDFSTAVALAPFGLREDEMTIRTRFLHFGFCAKKMTGAMSCRLKNTKCLEWRHLDIIKGLL